MQIFETVSFHIVKPCNAKCKFCYATFDDMHVKMMPDIHALRILDKLSKSGVQKVTFAGGEPLMYPHIESVIKWAKSLGMTTSIITNGFRLTMEFLEEMQGHLDWIGVSVDSLNPSTNDAIGRTDRFIGHLNYMTLVEGIKAYGYRLKINTVVNAYNWEEDMNYFIRQADPDRWKVFQALRVDGQNDQTFNEIRVSDDQYWDFLGRHAAQPSLVQESNELMTGSYVLIDPQGRMFENSAGKHTYSDSLIDYSVDHCLSQINLNRDRFIERGGIYNWTS